MVDDGLDSVLAEQAAYYRALAPTYLDTQLDLPGGPELRDALEAFRPAGNVLELACGPGTWTGQLLRHATAVTAVDSADEMLEQAREWISSDRVRFLRADLFSWAPDQRYDVVFFGFWLSHVPVERFAAFWAVVDAALRPDGRVFFVDDAYRTPEETVYGVESPTIRRTLPDGSAHRVIKMPYTVDELQARIAELGWDVTVHPTAGPFFWGAGRRETVHGPNFTRS